MCQTYLQLDSPFPQQNIKPMRIAEMDSLQSKYQFKGMCHSNLKHKYEIISGDGKKLYPHHANWQTFFSKSNKAEIDQMKN